jgi:hypothetical protein
LLLSLEVVVVQRLRSINPLQLGLVSAILYALISLIVAIPVTLISMTAGSAMKGQPMAALFAGPAVLIFFPIMYGAVGFIGGIITAALYNLVARWTGGIEVQLEPSGVAIP